MCARIPRRDGRAGIARRIRQGAKVARVEDIGDVAVYEDVTGFET